MTSVVTEDDKTTEDTQFNLGADFKGKANTTSTVIEIHYYYWRKHFLNLPHFLYAIQQLIIIHIY